MTVSHLTRSRDQLWSDLLVALGGSEAFLSRSISERRVLLEIMETFSVTVSTKDIDDLDELLEQVVIAAGGSASHLRQNKHEMLGALVTALGGTPPSSSSSSTGELLAACVNAVDTGGGGGGPVWLPSGAVAFADFKNAHYYAGGAEVADPNDMFQADAVDGDPWDASNIQAGIGLVALIGQEGAASFKGAALTSCLPGCTVVFDFELVAFGIFAVLYDGTTFQSYLQVEATYADLSSHLNDLLDSTFTPISYVGTGAVGGPNKMAATLTASVLSMSVNGEAVTTYPSPSPGLGVFGALTFYCKNQDIIRSVTVYAPKADAALPALSAL